MGATEGRTILRIRIKFGPIWKGNRPPLLRGNPIWTEILSNFAENFEHRLRAKSDGETIDWVVLRNRMQYIEARNMKRVSEAIDQLSKRVGFRVIPGLSERVIYRELFPQGLTMLDSREFGEMGLSHVAARQELREMMAGLALPEPVLPLFA